MDELGALVQCPVPVLGGLEQRAGGAAGQRGAVAVQGEAVAVRGAGAHGQQVVVARDVAVPGQVVRVLRVTGNHHGAGALDDTDGWFHVVDVLGRCGCGRGGCGDDGGGAGVCQVFMVSWRFHLHVAALRVFAQTGRVVDGGVRVFTVEGAGAGQGALHVV